MQNLWFFHQTTNRSVPPLELRKVCLVANTARTHICCHVPLSLTLAVHKPNCIAFVRELNSKYLDQCLFRFMWVMVSIFGNWRCLRKFEKEFVNRSSSFPAHVFCVLIHQNSGGPSIKGHQAARYIEHSCILLFFMLSAALWWLHSLRLLFVFPTWMVNNLRDLLFRKKQAAACWFYCYFSIPAPPHHIQHRLTPPTPPHPPNLFGLHLLAPPPPSAFWIQTVFQT